MIIPEQLHNQRFILVKDDKAPLEVGWQRDGGANYAITDTKFSHYLDETSRYGIVCGINNLIVIDFDDEETQKEALSSNVLPETFTVKTARKGLYHLYFYTDNASSWKILDKDKNTLADIQGRSKQVIGPGTRISDGREYSVVKDLPIATIPVALIHKVLDRFDYGKNQEFLQSTAQELTLDDFSKPKVDDSTIKDIKSRLKISDLLHEAGISTSRNPTKCPFHNSKGGKCFGFDNTKGVWHCFHCDSKGDAITLFQKINGIDDFVEAKMQLCKKFDLVDNFPVAVAESKVINIEEDYVSKGYDALMVEQYHAVLIEKKFTLQIITNTAKIMVKHFRIITVHETDEMFRYDASRGIYVKDAEILVMMDLERYFDHRLKTAEVTEVVNKIKRQSYKSIKIFTDAVHKAICLRNGVYDLDTRKLLPFSPEYFFINCFPIVYNPDAQCIHFAKFVSEIVHDDDVQTMYELFGWCLMPEYKIQRAAMLIGIGRNGKSVYLHVLKSFLGPENVSNQSIQALSNDKFSTHQLFGKIANIYSDLSSEEIKDTSAFKTLTSGMDAIRAEQKFKDQFTFVNRAKLLFSCNQIPKTNDVSDAFFRRWVIITFPFTFSGAAENKELASELVTDEELSGIFNIAIECYHGLKLNGDFTTNQSTDDVREIYTRMSDPIGSFILDKIEPSGDEYIPKDELYGVFKAYCISHKFPVSSEKMFSQVLSNRLLVMNYKASRADGERVMCWKGIAWKALQEGEDVSHDSA